MNSFYASKKHLPHERHKWKTLAPIEGMYYIYFSPKKYHMGLSKWTTVAEEIEDASKKSFYIPPESIITFIGLNFNVDGVTPATRKEEQYCDMHIVLLEKEFTPKPKTNDGPPIKGNEKQIIKTLFLSSDRDNGSYEFSGQLYTGPYGCCIGCTHNSEKKNGVGRIMITYSSLILAQ